MYCICCPHYCIASVVTSHLLPTLLSLPTLFSLPTLLSLSTLLHCIPCSHCVALVALVVLIVALIVVHSLFHLLHSLLHLFVHLIVEFALLHLCVAFISSLVFTRYVYEFVHSLRLHSLRLLIVFIHCFHPLRALAAVTQYAVRWLYWFIVFIHRTRWLPSLSALAVLIHCFHPPR